VKNVTEQAEFVERKPATDERAESIVLREGGTEYAFYPSTEQHPGWFLSKLAKVQVERGFMADFPDSDSRWIRATAIPESKLFMLAKDNTVYPIKNYSLRLCGSYKVDDEYDECDCEMEYYTQSDSDSGETKSVLEVQVAMSERMFDSLFNYLDRHPNFSHMNFELDFRIDHTRIHRSPGEEILFELTDRRLSSIRDKKATSFEIYTIQTQP